MYDVLHNNKRILMNSTYNLTDAQFQKNLQSDFRRDGFVFLKGFLKSSDVDILHNRITDFIVRKVPEMPKEQIYYEDASNKSTLKQLQELYKYDPFFKNLMFESDFETLASILLNEKVIGKNLQYFNKPPLIGQQTPPHQDGFYFKLEPNEAVTMWLALENVDEENGCIRYVSGSHLKGMRPHQKTSLLGFSQGITDFGTEEDILNEKYFTAHPGDLLVHHSLTIHRADGNTSETRSRKALGFIYYSEKAKHDEIAHKAYQTELAEELLKSKKI